MNKHRRKYKFADNQYHDVDMKQYSRIIIDTINKTVPNKHPKVFKDHFSTDPLTQSETVRVGRALSKLEELNSYGKTVKAEIKRKIPHVQKEQRTNAHRSQPKI